MARDYLSMPGMYIVLHLESILTQSLSDSLVATLVDVDQIFSKRQILLLHLHNGLELSTVRSLLCLGEWIDAEITTDKDLVTTVSGLNNLMDAGGWDDSLEPG